MLRPFEHEVLEQVREAGAAGHLVLRADVIPDVDRDNRAAVILVNQDVEAVRQSVLCIGDVQGGQKSRVGFRVLGVLRVIGSRFRF